MKKILQSGMFLLVLLLIGVPLESLMAKQGQQTSYIPAEEFEVSIAGIGNTFYKVDINKEISIDINNVTVERSLQKVAQKSGLKLTYRGDIMSDKKVTLNVNKISVTGALDHILNGTNLEYKFSRNGFLLISRIKQLNKTTLQEVVRGQVTDATTGETLPGVNIILKGTSTGTSSDMDGNYELTVPSLQDTLVFTFVGYQQQEIPINGRSEINVSLATQTIRGEEIMVSGYQIQERASVTGAISVVDINEAFSNKPVTNPFKSLQGQVAGLFINTTGDPSGATEVRVRGVSTLNDNNPLYVIDGIPTKESAFNVLNPNDIENVQVLKDASSSAIYGARASNGVILVTTKKSKKNTLSVNYNSQITFSEFNTLPEPLNREERATVHFWANINDGTDPDEMPNENFDWTVNDDGSVTLNDVSFPEFVAPGVRSADTNWLDVIRRTGLIQEHNLSVSTGGERTGALISARLYEDKYILKEKSFNRFSVRVNTHHDLTEDGSVRIGQNLSLSRGNDKGFEGSPLFGALNVRPILPVFTEDGGFSGPPSGEFVDSENPLRQLVHNRWDERRDLNLFGDVYANISILENLSLNSKFGVDWNNKQARNILLRYETGFLSRQINSLSNRKAENFSWNFNSALNYQLDHDLHSTSILAGTELTDSKSAFNLTRREDFAVETLDFFTEGAGSGNQFVDGGKTGFALLSFFGKVDYSFDSKYLASFTIRHDGSSKFAPGNRFGTFPSFTLGWRLDQESFFESNTFEEVKLRAGWGRTGNEQIANDSRFGLFDVNYGSEAMLLAPWQRGFGYGNSGTAYDIAGNDTGQLPSGFRRVQIANPHLRWEQTSEINVGLDFSFSNDKIFGSIDYFDRDTKDILIQPDFIAVLGEGGDRFLNGASVNVKGFELSATYRDQIGSFNYRISGNIGHFRDKITKLPDDVVDSFPGNSEQNILGHSMNSIFGYVTDGIFQNQSEVDSHADQPGKGIGRLRYKDLNGDGRITTLDQQYFGSSTADYEYGVNFQVDYNRFDFSMFWQGIHGRDVLETDRRRTDFTSLWAGTNHDKRILDFWTPENNDSEIPAVTLQDNNDEGRVSTFYLADGRYLKLRDVTIGYTISNVPVAKDFRIFVTGGNLLTFKSSSFKGEDPERPTSTFPRPRRLTLGINLTF